MLCLNMILKIYLHMMHISINASFIFIFKRICTTPAVHPFINLWMTHHRSTQWQYKLLHSNAASKKTKKISIMAFEKMYKERPCYLQCNSAKLAVRPNHSAPLRSRYQSRALRLIWYLRMNVKNAAVNATLPPSQTLMILQNKSFQDLGKYL